MRSAECEVRNGESGGVEDEIGGGDAKGKGELAERTKRFALKIIALADKLPQNAVGRVIQNQILRCGTSVGNYRSAVRSRSTADFISKMGVVEEEADEAMYWMELMIKAGLMPGERVLPLHAEAGEILAMTIASIRTARGGSRKG